MAFRTLCTLRYDVNIWDVNLNFVNAIKYFIGKSDSMFAKNLIKRWFGGEYTRVKDSLKNILSDFNSNNIIYIKNIPTTNNYAVSQNSVAYADIANRVIYIGSLWHTLPIFVNYQKPGNDRGAIKTLFHELSHILLNTEDVSVWEQVPWPNGPKQTKPETVPAYGILYSRRLANGLGRRRTLSQKTKDPNPITNADNWGYFLESIYRCHVHHSHAYIEEIQRHSYRERRNTIY